MRIRPSQSYLRFVAVVRSPIKPRYLLANSISGKAEELLARKLCCQKTPCPAGNAAAVDSSLFNMVWFFSCLCTGAKCHGCTLRCSYSLRQAEWSSPERPGKQLIAGGEKPTRIPSRQRGALLLGNTRFALCL